MAHARICRRAAQRATYCLGLHPKLPPLADQLPLLRALWLHALVCRWNLNEVHGPYGYEDAEKRYAPYDRLHDLDPATHEALAKVIVGITGRGQNAYVTISNHAEGCAPDRAAAGGACASAAHQMAQALARLLDKSFWPLALIHQALAAINLIAKALTPQRPSCSACPGSCPSLNWATASTICSAWVRRLLAAAAISSTKAAFCWVAWSSCVTACPT